MSQVRAPLAMEIVEYHIIYYVLKKPTLYIPSKLSVLHTLCYSFYTYLHLQRDIFLFCHTVNWCKIYSRMTTLLLFAITVEGGPRK
jgi:hypothetical protein